MDVQGGTGAERVAALDTSGPDAAGNGTDPVEARLDRRTRPQKLLDGLVGGSGPPLLQDTCLRREGSAPRSWQPSTTGTCWKHTAPANPRPIQTQANQPQATQFWASGHGANGASGTATHGTATHGALTARELTARAGPDPCCSPARSRRRPYARSPATPTYPGPARRRGQGSGHRPGLTGLSAAHPQGHHGQGPGVFIPAMHHPRAVVRSPPCHVLVPGRHAPEQTTERCCVRTTII